MANVKIFVRLPPSGDKNKRIIKFIIPDNMEQADIFALEDAAIDGAQVLIEVDEPFKIEGRNIRLHRIEREIAALIKNSGHTPVFL